MTPSQKTKIDLLVDKIMGHHHLSEKKNMLRTNFTKGMTNLSMVTADEQAGTAQTILVLTHTNKRKAASEERFDPDVFNDNQLASVYNDMMIDLQAFEGMGGYTNDINEDLEEETEEGGD
jgi:hypothetical protein